jgi:hypothetical protein
MKLEAEGMIVQVHMDSVNQITTFRKQHLSREYPKPTSIKQTKSSIPLI